MLQKFFLLFNADLFLTWARRLALLLFLIQLSYFCLIQTDGFTVQKIRSNLTYNPKFSTPIPESQELQSIQAILEKKFYYLGKGAQCYAFVSEDDNYILKLIRFPRVSINPILSKLPLPSFVRPFLVRKEQRMKERLDRLFSSFKIAHDELREETGILMLHLNKTNFLRTKITLCDKLNIEHVLDGDSLEFILQKKADLLYPILDRLMLENRVEEAKQTIDSILQLFVTRCQKGVFDADPNIFTNFGLIGNRVVEFDIGRFSLDADEKRPDVYLREINRITETFAAWLHKNHIEAAIYLDEQIALLSNEEKETIHTP